MDFWLLHPQDDVNDCLRILVHVVKCVVEVVFRSQDDFCWCRISRFDLLGNNLGVFWNESILLWWLNGSHCFAYFFVKFFSFQHGRLLMYSVACVEVFFLLFFCNRFLWIDYFTSLKYLIANKNNFTIFVIEFFEKSTYVLIIYFMNYGLRVHVFKNVFQIF